LRKTRSAVAIPAFLVRRLRVSVKINVEWDGDLRFISESEPGAKVTIEPGPAYGGTGKFQTPMQLVLSALGSCAAMDAVLIIQKMRMKISKFTIEIEGRRRKEEPRYYENIKILYRISGEDLDEAKVNRAVQLATDKYCSVGIMLREKAEITYEVKIE
jgi:putative redox protein